MDEEQLNGWPENRRYIRAELKRLADESQALRGLIDSNFKEHVDLHSKMEGVRVSLETAMREKLEKKIDDIRIDLVNIKVLSASRGGMYGAVAGLIASIIVSILAGALVGGAP
jgi:hypothetical protein